MYWEISDTLDMFIASSYRTLLSDAGESSDISDCYDVESFLDRADLGRRKGRKSIGTTREMCLVGNP